MRSVDLETFHRRIKNSIQIASDYVNEPLFGHLVRACRLKPHSVFTGQFQKNTLEYCWIDEFGYCLDLSSNRTLAIKQSPTSNTTQIGTDLWFGLGTKALLPISKVAILHPSWLLLYGKDEYLRCFNLETRNKASPLECGVELIIELLRNMDRKTWIVKEDWMLYRLPNAEIEQLISKELSL